MGVNDSRIQKLEFRSSGMVTTKNVKFLLFSLCVDAWRYFTLIFISSTRQGMAGEDSGAATTTKYKSE